MECFFFAGNFLDLEKIVRSEEADRESTLKFLACLDDGDRFKICIVTQITRFIFETFDPSGSSFGGLKKVLELGGHEVVLLINDEFWCGFQDFIDDKLFRSNYVSESDVFVVNTEDVERRLVFEAVIPQDLYGQVLKPNGSVGVCLLKHKLYVKL
jgi:hypothetical protein